ncbi:MAG TPA: hypothetical protein VIN59_01250 [Alphaproteobacteria bacterium]
MSLDSSLNRLASVVSDLEKIAAERENDVKSRQIDLFGNVSPKKNPTVDNTLMAKTLDRTIERIENLLQVGSR